MRTVVRPLVLVTALLLLPGFVGMALPCPDDLLVESGDSADQCLAGSSGETAPPDSTPSVCPCACHFGITFAPEAPRLPAPVVAALLFPMKGAGLDAVPAPITHPPLS